MQIEIKNKCVFVSILINENFQICFIYIYEVCLYLYNFFVENRIYENFDFSKTF
jgi:hypothetical protein